MDQDNPLRDRRRRRPVSIPMHGTNLKLYGCVAMLCHTISMAVLQNGLIGVGQYTGEELSQALQADPDLMVLSGWASVLQLIGGLAVPVFAFLLVEGFLHTSSFRRYLLTLLAFALASEVPYDLAVRGSLWDLTGQNVLFTLAVCLIMLYGLRLLEGRKGLLFRLAQGAMAAAALLWCMILRSDVGLCMVLLTAVYYLAREKRGLRILLGCAISALYVTGPISGYALWNYTGERGWNKNKYVFYLFYPLHLLVLGLLGRGLALL